MGKASKRKQADPPAPPPLLPDPPRWAVRLLAASALAGAALSSVATYVHHRVVASGGAYTSFCNLSAAVNCDTVVASRFGMLLGVPVAAWGLAYYLALFLVALRAGGRASVDRDRARADAAALVAFGVLFSLYLATASVAVLHTICLLCAGLYTVSALCLLAAWHAAPALDETWVRVRERATGVARRPVVAVAGIGAVAAVLFLPSWLPAPTRMTRQEIFRTNPQFYEWYTSQPVVDPPDHGGNVEGPGDAPLELVEFSDFECPHCARAHVVLKDVLPRYKNEVKFVFRYFPLSNECNDAMPARGHEHACAAAVAAQCAAEQGRFPAYENLLFAHQEALTGADLRGYAKDAGLDLAAYDKCLADPSTAERVKADVEAGKRAGVRSTPTFFLNGRRIEGNMPFESWLLAFGVELDKG